MKDSDVDCHCKICYDLAIVVMGFATACIVSLLKVKFFERKKVTRNISKLEKLIAAASVNGDKVDALMKQKEYAEGDLAVSDDDARFRSKCSSDLLSLTHSYSCTK